MFYYINQLHTPCFPIGLIKTESHFTVRSVEIYLRRWTLAVAVVSVNAYPFLGFPRPDLLLWEYGNTCFLIRLCHLIKRRLNLKVGFSISRSKYQGSLSAVFIHGSASLQLFLVMLIFLKSLGVICYYRWVLIEGHKNYFKDCYLMNLHPTFLLSTYFNSMNYGHIIKRM